MTVMEVAVFLQYIMLKFIFLIKFNFLWMEYVNISPVPKFKIEVYCILTFALTLFFIPSKHCTEPMKLVFHANSTEQHVYLLCSCPVV